MCRICFHCNMKPKTQPHGVAQSWSYSCLRDEPKPEGVVDVGGAAHFTSASVS